ncbi:MAG: hypothetical protein PHZ00_03645 [Candidatus Peribacteraceae bacterium]|nr:hypothetical protein [Candidatus Peribacteraceae bacterium]
MQHPKKVYFFPIIVTIEQDTVAADTQPKIRQTIMLELAHVQTLRPQIMPKFPDTRENPQDIFPLDGCQIPVPKAFISDQQCVGHVS